MSDTPKLELVFFGEGELRGWIAGPFPALTLDHECAYDPNGIAIAVLEPGGWRPCPPHAGGIDQVWPQVSIRVSVPPSDEAMFQNSTGGRGRLIWSAGRARLRRLIRHSRPKTRAEEKVL